MPYSTWKRMNFLTEEMFRHSQIEISLNLICFFKGGASTSCPSPYLSGWSLLYSCSYFKSSGSFPVASGLLSRSSLRKKHTIAKATTKKKHIVNAILGCWMSMRQVPMTQPTALPMEPNTVEMVEMSPRPFSMSFLLCSTKRVSFIDTTTNPKRQSKHKHAKKVCAVFAISVNMSTRQNAWARLQKKRIYLLLLTSLKSIHMQTGNLRKTIIWRITSKVCTWLGSR